jgi:two-component system, cell cycle sensor histidine kinase and response regulator CckA
MSAPPVSILVVDDDEDDHIITRDLFADIGRDKYEVEWTGSYEAALDLMLAQRHDIYLIDFLLGARSGLDLLRTAQSHGINAPIILLTGQSEQEVDSQAIRCGAEDFLVKGQIDAPSLERSVRYAIERKAAEREIQKLASFPRCNPNPVLEFAADGALNYSNEAALVLARSLGADSIEAVLPPGTPAIVAECLSTGQSNFQIQSTLKNRTFSWCFIPIPGSRLVHCYATEITERLSLELQLRHLVKMEAIGQLAAGVAHDFNNILTIVQGHANLLLDDPALAPANQKHVRQISAASERAGSLTRQLLMFSRKQVMQQRLLDLNEVISNVIAMLQRLLGEDIRLEYLPEKKLPAICADAGMIEQILMNLAVNARDAMPDGGQLLLCTSLRHFTPETVQTNPEAHPGICACLQVSDSGCGMEPAVMSRIFEPFFTTKEIGKGTGLGLATVYAVVKQHEGWIEVESRVGRGTTFTIYFPASVAVPPTAPGMAVAEVKCGHETILVVEDEPALCDLVASILEIYGYKVFSAKSGVAALEVWREHKDSIDLLLTDMVMPGGVSGRELAERLLCESPALNVIYTSGYSPGMAGKDLALMEGFNFLPKPYPPARLAQMVRECLNAGASANRDRPGPGRN